MSDNTTTIPCPICKTKIPFNAMGLINGKVFPSCDASISLSNGSKPSIKSTIDKLEELKKLK
jgi:hypothetical protein